MNKKKESIGRNLAIIPARSGSKGVIDKNIKALMGRPLMAYSIVAAKESNCFSEIMVSTDSEKYASIAREQGAKVPFLRSSETASDNADKWDMVREVLNEYKKRDIIFDSVCVLQPTSPLRTSEDIQLSYELFRNKKANTIISVCKCEHPPVWSGTIGEDGSLVDFNKPEMFIPRQQLPTYYRLNGAIFIAKTDVVMEKKAFYDEKCYAFIMSEDKSVDIDNEFDFRIAEIYLEK